MSKPESSLDLAVQLVLADFVDYFVSTSHPVSSVFLQLAKNIERISNNHPLEFK